MKYVINAFQQKSKINKEIYGHFSEHLGRCIYEGIYVGKESPIPNTDGIRNDVASALKKMKIPVLRWPGGCFADEYHWKDGIGPLETRKKMINTHWGGVVEDNSFGLHEFMTLCEMLECEPYVNGNLGSGTVAEMQELVEYATFDGLSPMTQLRKENGREKPWKLKYFGVGNENWGCGGNMRPEYYADEYRRYQTYTRNYSGNELYKIACGASDFNYDWTEKLMAIAGRYMHGLSVHYYTVPTGIWEKKGSATEFNTAEYYETLRKTLRMEELLVRHGGIMDKYDPDKKVGMIVDEWGAWYDVEPGTNPGFLYQQNTMRDAMIAGINLNLFNKHSDRVKMANIAQLVNVLQSVILTEGEKMLLSPTYHVFDMYQVHQEAQLLQSDLLSPMIDTENGNFPQVSESASLDLDGKLHITLCNLSLTEDACIDAQLVGKTIQSIDGLMLKQSMDAHNTFDQPEHVKAEDFSGAAVTREGFTLTLPACSIVRLTLSC